MNEPPQNTPSSAPRKPWRRPEIVALPVEETAHFASTGNDGNGSSTGS